MNKKEDITLTAKDICENHLKQNQQCKSQLVENNNVKTLNRTENPYNKYFEFYHHAPLGFFMLNKKGIIKDVNIKGAAILGYHHTNLLNIDFMSFIIRDHRNFFNKKVFNKISIEDESFKINLKKAKDIICVKIQINQLLDNQNNLTGYKMIITDTTQQMKVENELKSKYEYVNSVMKKRTEELLSANQKLRERIEKNKLSDKKLRANEKREQTRSEEFARVLDAVPAAVWISHDKLGQWITGNQLSYDYLDISPFDNISKSSKNSQKPVTFKIFKNGREINTEDMPVQLSSRGNEIKNYEFDFVYPNKPVRHMMGNATPLYDENKNPRGSVSVFIDVTTNKEAEIKMKKLVKEL